MKILFAGGGTMGSVSPLLAVVPHLQKDGHTLQFVGTYTGPEKPFIEKAGVPFTPIVAPKFRRYLTWRHLLLPFELLIAVLQAAIVLLRFRPDVIVSAAGFVAVPLVWVGWLFRIPALIHQQDIQPSLSNKLMQPFAKKITVAFEESLKHFPKDKTVLTGNPVRDLTPTTHEFGDLDADYPTVLIFGGGTGAQAINQLVSEELCEFANVIHITGKGRGGGHITHPHYHAYEILREEMKEALHVADVVVARAGIGTITELAALGKPAIIIPMPNTHQELNAQMLKKYNAAIVLNQEEVTEESVIGTIRGMDLDTLSKNISALQSRQSIDNIMARILSITEVPS